jgi:hypothetical protein
LVRLCFEMRVVVVFVLGFFLMNMLVVSELLMLNLHLWGMFVVFKLHPSQGVSIMEFDELSFWIFWWLI